MSDRQIADLQVLIERFTAHDACLRAHRHCIEKGPPIEKLKTLVTLLDKWIRLYEKLQEVIRDFSPIYGEILRLRREQLTPAQLNVAYVQDKWDTSCRSLREFIMLARGIKDDKVQPLEGINTAGQLDDRTQWAANVISKLETGAKKIEDRSVEGNKGDLYEAISTLYYDLEGDDFRIYAEMKNITANLRAMLL